MPEIHTEMRKPLFLHENTSTNLKLGLYAHVPFCATTCDFCAFVQSKPTVAKKAAYLEAIAKEWSFIDSGDKQHISTVFIGGGTPGLLSSIELNELCKTIGNGLNRDNLQEWSIEMAPGSVTPEKLKVLKNAGVNRISMGVQTFNPRALEIIGRDFNVDQVFRAYDWIRDAEFKNVNLDLIIAYPGQTIQELEDDLEKTIALDPEHISTYCLTFEEDTALYSKLMQRIYKIDLEAESELYRFAWDYLESKGYRQYEISNFAKTGLACIHNQNTWQMQEWIGIGPSASSQYQGYRYTNSYDTDHWIKHLDNPKESYEEHIELTPEMIAVDRLIFGLRMNQGVSIDELAALKSAPYWDSITHFLNQCATENLLTLENQQACLTLEGRLKADAIAAEILNLAD